MKGDAFGAPQLEPRRRHGPSSFLLRLPPSLPAPRRVRGGKLRGTAAERAGARAAASDAAARVIAARSLSPAIALTQPPDGGTVYQDRPTILLRFVEGEPGDRLDLASFALSVDGVDRTGVFQLSATEAWGSLAASADGALAIGAHRITARICSVRGVCSTLGATVVVIPPFVAGPGNSTVAKKAGVSRVRRLLEAAVDVTRRILTP